MKKVVLAVLVVGVMCMSAQGSILNQFVTFDGPTHLVTDIYGAPYIDGGEDSLTDESRADMVNADDSWELRLLNGNLVPFPTITDGDIFFGMIVLSEIDASGLSNADIGQTEQLAMVYSGVVSGLGVDANNVAIAATVDDIVSLVPVGDATNAYDLRMLLDDDIDTTAAGLTDDSVMVMVGNERGTSEGGTAPQDFGPSAGQTTTIDEILEFNSSNSFGDTWTWEATTGIVGDDGDFWEVMIDSLLPPQFEARERGGFSITSHDYGAAVKWLDVDVLHFDGTVSTHDATLDSALVTSTASDPEWVFRDDSVFVINPVPEPVSIVIWSAMAGLMGLGYLRRRRANR